MGADVTFYLCFCTFCSVDFVALVCFSLSSF